MPLRFLTLIAGCLSLASVADADALRLLPSTEGCTLEIALPLDRIDLSSVQEPEEPRSGVSSGPLERVEPARSPAQRLDSAVEAPVDAAGPACGRPYASEGSTAWWFEGSLATNFDEGTALMGGVGVEWYPVNGFAIGLRGDAIGVSLKDTDRTFGVGATILLRWHVLNRDRWSLYFDGGCGVAWFTDPVPAGAAQLDFTPELGIGCSFEIRENVRLLTGLRWFHVSNGQTARRNPGVDMLSAYLGVTMPF